MSRPILIEVAGSFTARHRCIEGALHGHTWQVQARFQPPARVDAQCYRAALHTMLSQWDGGVLPEGKDWNEDIVFMVSRMINCVWVRVWREAEQLGCVWEAE